MKVLAGLRFAGTPPPRVGRLRLLRKTSFAPFFGPGRLEGLLSHRRGFPKVRLTHEKSASRTVSVLLAKSGGH
jgi:hypothetical protein